MALKATEAIEELERIVNEFGDAELVMPDPVEATYLNPVDRIEFNSERQAIMFVTDRLPQAWAGTDRPPGRNRWICARSMGQALVTQLVRQEFPHPLWASAPSTPRIPRRAAVPRVSFKQEFKSADTERFPKLKLAVAEKSRLWIPAREEPWMEWYHRIEAPLIEHGEPAMEVKETRRGPVETWKMDWIGNVFCLGETGTPESPGPLMLAGIDPANCPACESAASKTGVAAPQQRFSINVIKYKVKGRGSRPYDLASPISAEVLLWGYTSRIFGMLHELESEHGDLSRHDIKLELEDSPGADTYQKIKQLAVIVEPAYTNPQVKAYLRDLWSNVENRATDDQLRDACLGRDVPRLVMMDMVRRAEKQYHQAEQVGSGGGDTGAADSGFNGDLSEGIGGLLDSGPLGGDDQADAATSSADPWLGETNAALQAIDAEKVAGGGLDEFADPTDADIDRLPHSAFQAPEVRWLTQWDLVRTRRWQRSGRRSRRTTLSGTRPLLRPVQLRPAPLPRLRRRSPPRHRSLRRVPEALRTRI